MGATDDPFEDVAVDRVDAVIPAADQARIAFIKIDVEGFERSALEGARAILEASRPTILFEVSIDALGRAGLTPADIYTYLGAYGYALFLFD